VHLERCRRISPKSSEKTSTSSFHFDLVQDFSCEAFVSVRPTFRHQSRSSSRRRCTAVAQARRCLKVRPIREILQAVPAGDGHPFEVIKAQRRMQAVRRLNWQNSITASLKFASNIRSLAQIFFVLSRSMKIARQLPRAAQSMSRHRSPIT